MLRGIQRECLHERYPCPHDCVLKGESFKGFKAVVYRWTEVSEDLEWQYTG